MIRSNGRPTKNFWSDGRGSIEWRGPDGRGVLVGRGACGFPPASVPCIMCGFPPASFPCIMTSAMTSMRTSVRTRARTRFGAGVGIAVGARVGTGVLRHLRRWSVAALSTGLVAAWTPCAAEEAEASIERLLQLNAAVIFGGECSIQDGRVTVRFPGKGSFGRGFTARGSRGAGFYTEDTDVKDGALRKVLIEGAKGQFACLGRDAGQAVSGFELADDWRVSFRLRIAALPPNAVFTVTGNQQDARNYIQVVFFREIVAVDGGKKKRALTTDKTYAAPPANWYDRKSPGVPFEISFKEGKLSVAMTIEAAKEGDKGERIELVSMEGIESATYGKLSFEFRNLSFLMSDLVVEGKVRPAWAQGEIARLKKAGGLKVKEADKPAEKKDSAPPPTAKDLGIPGIPPPRKVDKPDLNKPDPGAGDEL